MTDDLYRIASYEKIRPFLDSFKASDAVAEVSGGALRQEFGFERVTELCYPGFDLCNPQAREFPYKRYELVFADQVLEHVVDPWKAAATMWSMLKDGGKAILTTVFDFPYHPGADYGDYWRFSDSALETIFTRVGFAIEAGGMWGNLEARNLSPMWSVVARRPEYRRLAEKWESQYPIISWIVAVKPDER